MLYLFDDSCFRSQTMKERLAGWRRSLQTTEQEAEAHYTGQAEKIISLQQQKRLPEGRASYICFEKKFAAI